MDAKEEHCFKALSYNSKAMVIYTEGCQYNKIMILY